MEAGDWDGDPTRIEVARTIVAQFRADAFRAGYGPRAQVVVDALTRTSASFREFSNDQEVDLRFGPVKTFALPGRGEVKFEHMTLSVDGHPGLKLVVLNPATGDDRVKVTRLIKESRIP